jgi:U32 family peptidase
MNHTNEKQRKPELLSPAGSLEAFFAALEKGADAVYAGLSEFSARARAKNFTLPLMARAVSYAHSQGKRVYVTLNTLVKETELPVLIEGLAALEEMQADGVIVQDLAVARLVRRHFPGLPLHASTQLTIHNSLGVQQLEELGFERVVLARELHLDDIRRIISQSKAEIEVFVHGALCFSISGQCFFSSFLGGHSGNRGRCTQPCRRQYSHRGKDGFYFSPNDLSGIDILPQLADAGVASLKIEGRMKSAEYVASVVSAYRLVLDAPEQDRIAAVAQAKELLKLSFGRVPTKGFLASRTPTDIATPSLKGATGRFLGEIKSMKNGRITFETRDRLHVGDRIRVQPKNDRAGRGFTVKELFSGATSVKVIKEKGIVTVVSPFPCVVGDTVFKVSTETAFTMSENACLRRLDSARGATIPCDLTLTLNAGILRITGTAQGTTVTTEFPLGDLEPSRTDDMTGILAAQFGKSGDTPFALRSLTAPDFPPVLIPPARLKEIRREFFRTLAETITTQRKRHRREAQAAATADLAGKLPVTTTRQPDLIVRTDSLRDWHLLHREEVTALSFPVSRANLHQLPQMGRKLQGREHQVWWRLPFFIPEEELSSYGEAVSYLKQQGFTQFEAANISHFPLLRGESMGGRGNRRGEARLAQENETATDAVTIATDYRLFSLNSQALLSWHELGCSEATLYIEDDDLNLGALLATDVPIHRRVIIYAPVPVITSKIGVKSIRDESPVQSDRGEGYEVTQKEGMTVITPTTRFSLIRHRNRLLEMGCRCFVVDLSGLNREDKERVLDAVKRGAELPGTSEFNFSMGLV